MRVCTSLAAAAFAALLIAPVPAAAQTPQRLTDDDVKQLIEDVDKGRDVFEDRLDGRLKDSILRGPSTEMKVSKSLDDFQDHVKQLKERFTHQYAASQEAQTLLEQATMINAFIKTQPADLKGGSEWDRLVVDLKRLAGTYGTFFPLPTPAMVRRINDGEAAATAIQIAKLADVFKNSVNKEKTVAIEVKDKLKADAETLHHRAEALESRLSDSKPATAEARQVFDAMSRIHTDVSGISLASTTMTALGAMRAPMTKLEQAFGLGTGAGTKD